MLLKGLEFFEIGYGFGLLPGDGLIVLDVVMGFGFVVDAFFDFFHFFGVGLLGGILFMIKVLTVIQYQEFIHQLTLLKTYNQ